MYRAFPGSEYYGGSALPGPISRRCACPSFSWLKNRRGRDQSSSHVHLSPIDEGGTQLYPDGPHTYAADNSAWALDTTGCGIERAPATQNSPVPAVVPAQIHQVSSRLHLTRRQPLVPCVYLLISLAGPMPSGSADPSRLCQGRLPPESLHLLRDSGCPQLHQVAATTRRRRS